MHLTKNNDMILLAALAGVAGLFLLTRKSDTNGGGDGGGSSAPLFGTNGPESPTIYQLPSESFAGFPQSSGLDLAGLMSLFTGGQVADATATKKEYAVVNTRLDAGQVLPDGTIIKSPFVSRTAAPAATPVTGVMNAMNPVTQVNFLDRLLFGAAGNVMNLVAPSAAATPSGTRNTAIPDYAGASVGAAIESQTKKEAYVSGYSNQYIVDDGLLYWNPYEGYGTSTITDDSGAQKTVAFQRDVYIGGSSGPLYAPDGSVGSSKKEAMIAVSWDNGETFSYSRALDANEYAKAHAQADPNYVVGSWGSTKKESSIAASNGGGNGGSSAPGNSYSAETAASAPAGIDMSSAPTAGGSWDDYW